MSMRELLVFIVRSIAKQPEEVEVIEEEKEGILHLKLRVSSQDIGKIIGKGGKVILAIKNLLRVVAVQENRRFFLEVEPPNSRIPPPQD